MAFWNSTTGFEILANQSRQETPTRAVGSSVDGTYLLGANDLGVSVKRLGAPPHESMPLTSGRALTSGWQGTLLMAAEADPNGAFHLLVREFKPPAFYGKLGYLAWSPTAGVVNERLLLDPPTLAAASARPLVADDFHSIRFGGGKGVAAWGGDGSLHWVTLTR